jgi:spore germination protein GerM
VTRRALLTSLALLVVVSVGSAAYVVVARARRHPAARAAAPAAPAPAPAAPGRRIKAHLYYVAEDGLHLQAVDRDVPYADGAEQAREILNAQIAPVTNALVSAIPPGTSIRTVFLTAAGDAYVDFTHEMVSGHSGGTVNELLTVYTIVDALTANLPSIRAVQILVDGRELRTLAGHIDLRQPLTKNLSLVQ